MRLGLRGKGRHRDWSIVENRVRVGNRQRCPRCGERSTLSRVPGTVLADRFPANNWKCKRNRPPCDSSIIESLISVWMRPLSRFRALCPDRSRTPSPYLPSSSGAVSSLSSARYRQSLRIPRRVLVVYMLERLVKTHITGERTDASRLPWDALRAGVHELLGRCMYLCARASLFEFISLLVSEFFVPHIQFIFLILLNVLTRNTWRFHLFRKRHKD